MENFVEGFNVDICGKGLKNEEDGDDNSNRVLTVARKICDDNAILFLFNINRINKMLDAGKLENSYLRNKVRY